MMEERTNFTEWLLDSTKFLVTVLIFSIAFPFFMYKCCIAGSEFSNSTTRQISEVDKDGKKLLSKIEETVSRIKIEEQSSKSSKEEKKDGKNEDRNQAPAPNGAAPIK